MQEMASTFYDPENPPPAAAWLALSQTEQLRLITQFHSSQKQASGPYKSHAALHAIAEGYLARGHGPSRKALAALMAAGHGRHEALHRVGRALVAGSESLAGAALRELAQAASVNKASTPE